MTRNDRLTALEELTFRRIANAGAKTKLLRARDVQRLRDLGLVIVIEERAMLSEFGQARFAENQSGRKLD